jgi:2,5-diamino-6-(ribosylamino)-4(3H)-pyrimidinone 5'-phosphate reductase
MDRPYVICHMCTTIDGKILPRRWGRVPGVRDSADLFETTAASFGIGAWLVGTTTMREFSGGQVALPPSSARVPDGDFIGNESATSFAIGADAKGALRFQNNEVEGDHIVVLVTNRASAPYLAHLRRTGVSYLMCGKSAIDLRLALHKIRRALDVRNLMLEGGGAFNGSMLRAGLVDEISLVILPVVDGGGPEITGVFDAPGTPPGRAAATLRVTSHEELPGSVHWFRYRVRGR